jgi:hypothetical protein
MALGFLSSLHWVTGWSAFLILGGREAPAARFYGPAGAVWSESRGAYDGRFVAVLLGSEGDAEADKVGYELGAVIPSLLFMGAQ